MYLDFLGDPNEVNARNYGVDYYVVVFPSPASTSDRYSNERSSGDAAAGSPLKMDQIRHTYLHYLMDPMAEKHFTMIKRLEPLLQPVKRSALDENFKTDISAAGDGSL